jgi:hypothetical protein
VAFVSVTREFLTNVPVVLSQRTKLLTSDTAGPYTPDAPISSTRASVPLVGRVRLVVPVVVNVTA